MPWLWLIVGGVFEVGFTTSLRFVDGFRNVPWTIAFLISVAISMCLLEVASRAIPMGTAYAVWGGIGAVGAARRALAKAGLQPADVAHVNAHATSTPEGDKAELQAIRTIFGDHAEELSITANKSMIGHSLGAAGAIEAIVTILTMREGCVPPTINLQHVDPAGEGLDLTPHAAARRDVPIALSNSFGFGGQNTALIFRRWTE